MRRSCLKSEFSKWEVLFSLLDLEDLFSFLVGWESGSESSGEFSSKELSSFAWWSVKVTSKGSSLLLVEDGKVSGDVLSDSFDFSQLGSATWWGLSVSKVS